jgi:hypothetical protein
VLQPAIQNVSHVAFMVVVVETLIVVVVVVCIISFTFPSIQIIDPALTLKITRIIKLNIFNFLRKMNQKDSFEDKNF